MYAVGHFALGYLTGKLTAKSLNTTINIPLLFLASIFPDIDILIPGLVHRGPLHSILLFFLVFIPIVIIYKKRAIPYFIAVISHLIIGDYIIGGNLQLLWPLTTDAYGFDIVIGSVLDVALEWSLFLISMAVLIKTKDVFLLLKPIPSNIILVIPLVAVLLPTTISYPLQVPLSLLLPHIIFLILLASPIIIYSKTILTKTKKP